MTDNDDAINLEPFRTAHINYRGLFNCRKALPDRTWWLTGFRSSAFFFYRFDVFCTVAAFVVCQQIDKSVYRIR